MDTFAPGTNPSTNGTQINLMPRLITTQFGDGYKQSFPDGLNANPITVTLVWSSISTTNGNAILSFLAAHVGVTFYYQLPNETITRKFQWLPNSNYSFLSADVMTISLNLEERFDEAT